MTPPTVSRTGPDPSFEGEDAPTTPLHALAMAQVDAAVVVADASDRIVEWNPGAERLFGWSSPEVVGRTWSDLVGPAELDPDARRVVIRERLAAGLSHRGELTVRARDGQRLPIHVEGGPIRDADGTIVGSIGIAFDDRRRSAAETRFETFFRHAPMAVAITSVPEQLVLDVNPAFESLTGYSAHQVVGRPATDLDLWDLDAAETAALAAELQSANLLDDVPVRLRTAGGERRQIRVFGRPIELVDGPALMWMGVDETAQVRTEAALRATASRLEAIVAASPMAIAVFDREQRVQLWNAAAERLFGFSAAQAIGRRNPAHVVDRSQVVDLVTRVFAGEVVSGVEMDIVARDGQRVHAELHAAPIPNERGEFDTALSMVTDITRRRELEARLREAQTMESVGFLAGGVAHDFNNLMTTISGYASLALDAVGRDHAIAGDLQEIARAAERAGVVTRRLLAFSRRQVHRPERVDLTTLIEALRPSLQQATGDDIRVSLVSDGQPTLVSLDPSQFEQVLVELAINARDAMPAGGSFRLAWEVAALDRTKAAALLGDLPAGRYVCLTVADSGPGMAPEVAARAFEPFTTTKAPGAATGLGLAVAVGIIEQSGGRISLASGATGTTVSIVLPWIGDLEGASSGLAGGPAAGVAATILVVEDEEAIRNLARRVLEDAGYIVVTADDGVRGLETAERLKTLDLLLTDLTMPRLSGEDLAARLTQRRPGLPVLFMSGYGQDRLAADHVLDPSIRLLAKPFGIDELLAAVREALGRPSLT